MSTCSRRQFLESSAKKTAGMAAGVVGVSAAVAGATSDVRPVRVGVIGTRQQGMNLASRLVTLPEVAVTWLCDVDERVVAQAAAKLERSGNGRPRTTGDHRRLLDDSTLDAVIIATPDHWHVPLALEGLEAGKDLYLETPVSLRLSEHDSLRIAAEESRQVIQTGLPQRSGEHFRSAIHLLRSGRLGRVRLAKAWAVHRRGSIGFKSPSDPPTGVDYDRWLGPAAGREFSANRFHHNWNWFWDYGSGELGRWGSQLLDLAVWGLDVQTTPQRISAVGGKFVFHDDQETPDTMTVQYSFPNSTLMWEHRQWSSHAPEGRSAAVSFCGENGTLIVDRGGWKVYGGSENLSSPGSDSQTTHLADFVQSIRTRCHPSADLETGLRVANLVHLGNAAYRQGRELRFDA